MLIAVTSSDGILVDTHFGKADRFLVYRVGDGELLLAAEVPVAPYCGGGGPGHGLMPDKLAALAQALGDCRTVVTAMIGEAPREELERLGITVHCCEAPVSDVLREVAKLF